MILLSTMLAFRPDTDICTINGNLQEESSGPIKLRYDTYYLGEDLTELSAELKGKKFTILAKISKPLMAELIYHCRPHKIYIEPGGDLQIDIAPEDSMQINNTRYSGSLGDENTYLAQFHQRFEDKKTLAELAELDAGSSIDKLEILLYDRRAKEIQFLNGYSGKKDFSKPFNKYAEWAAKYEYINRLLAFSVEKAKLSTAKNITPLPRIILEEINESYLNNNDQLFNPLYREFINLYIYYKSLEDNKFIKFDDMTKSCEAKYVASSRELSREAHNFFMASFLYDNCEKISPPVIIRYQKLLKLQADAYYAAVIEKHCGERIAQYDPVAEAEETKKKDAKKKEASQPFELVDEKGDKVYLSDFKGKVVYLDFWASWCGPCRSQMKAVPDLKTKMGKDLLDKIVFLYISIDNGPAEWKKGIEQNQVHGINVLSPGGWSSQVVKHFNLSSIPRYMIMNKKGEFVNTNAKRPSDAELLIEELKKYATE